MSKHKCRKAMLRVCHCIVVERETFRACCGWYCGTCGGHISNHDVRELQVRR